MSKAVADSILQGKVVTMELISMQAAKNMYARLRTIKSVIDRQAKELGFSAPYADKAVGMEIVSKAPTVIVKFSLRKKRTNTSSSVYKIIEVSDNETV